LKLYSIPARNVSDFLDVKLKKYLRATISFFSTAHIRCRKGFNFFDVYIEYTRHEKMALFV